MLNEERAYWIEQIHDVLPGLDIREVELHQEGLVNDVLIVNREWVIRFTKTDWGKELMALEGQLMHYLQPFLPLRIPQPEVRSDGIMVYALLEGDDFTREVWVSSNERRQQRYAGELGTFLFALHHVPVHTEHWEIPLTLAPISRDTWADIYQRVRAKIHPLLLAHQIKWVDGIFQSALSDPAFFDFETAVIHGDLSPYHILHSSKDQKLSGVIDFGIAGLGDPATDLGTLIYAYGERLVSGIKLFYKDYDQLLPRARFYAQAMEVQWVLLGVESGEDYWFTAHLGGARDIQP